VKTIADFKRAMTLGSIWKTTHHFEGGKKSSLGVHMCISINTVRFCLVKVEDGLPVSYANWPKATQYSFINGVAFIDKGWVITTYQPGTLEGDGVGNL